jgi:hypothetical protein
LTADDGSSLFRRIPTNALMPSLSPSPAPLRLLSHIWRPWMLLSAGKPSRQSFHLTTFRNTRHLSRRGEHCCSIERIGTPTGCLLAFRYIVSRQFLVFGRIHLGCWNIPIKWKRRLKMPHDEIAEETSLSFRPSGFTLQSLDSF